MKKALVIGIDAYPNNPLHGCVNDAVAISQLLQKNGDGSPNFGVKLVTSNESEVNSERLHTDIPKLFEGEADTALLFFSGHGTIDQNTHTGYLVSQDAKKGAIGYNLNDILTLANQASPRIKSTVIILDCCCSGYMGEASVISQGSSVSVIGKGITILTACMREQNAVERNGQGLFTSILLDGLGGASADICGRISPASLYSHVDQTLGEWEQRPIYKANVQQFITLRTVPPKIPMEVLRQLPSYFPNAEDIFPLDPTYEPDRENIPQELRTTPINEEHVRIFKGLQACNRLGLVVPVNAEHMYYAAINSTGCKLTALGAHYRNLAGLGRI